MCVYFIKMCHGGEWKIEIVLISRHRRRRVFFVLHGKKCTFISVRRHSHRRATFLRCWRLSVGALPLFLFAQWPIEIESSYLLLGSYFKLQSTRGAFSLIFHFFLCSRWVEKPIICDVCDRWRRWTWVNTRADKWEINCGQRSELWDTVGIRWKKNRERKNSINQIREEISLICTLSGVLIKSGLRNYPDRGIRQAKLAEELKKIFALLLLPSWTISRKNLSALGLPPPRCGVCFCSRRHQAKRSLQRRAE